MSRMTAPVNRRQFLQALGLGALASAGWKSTLRTAMADGGSAAPARIVFFIQPHGHVPTEWTMPIPNAPPAADRIAERSLESMTADEFSTVLRPLHPFRKRILAIEGLSHTSVLEDIAQIRRAGKGDLNNHNVAVAQLLTLSKALQRSNVPCTGGARSLDQELANRLKVPGRFGSRVYGYNYVPNQIVAPFSFLGAGQASPVVNDPATAFVDLLGYLPEISATPREEQIRKQRPSVLDTAAREYEVLAPKLNREGRRRLDDHRQLIRDLETSLLAPVACAGKVDHAGHAVSQFMQLIKLAFTCDLTRVVTFVAPVPELDEFGYPNDPNVVHTYAHASINGNTSCGQIYTPRAEKVMVDLGVWYANHVAFLMSELDSIPEANGNGTLLDHTLIVWVSEIATPTHQHHDVCTLIAGGSAIANPNGGTGTGSGTGSGSGFFDLGKYVRFPRLTASPWDDVTAIGPPVNRLYVSLMNALGQPDDSFGGITEARATDGTTLSLRGALTEIHKRK
jgi:hypothetical protein